MAEVGPDTETRPGSGPEPGPLCVGEGARILRACDACLPWGPLTLVLHRTADSSQVHPTGIRHLLPRRTNELGEPRRHGKVRRRRN